MRIALSGPSSSGKTTILNSFLRRWPMYATPMKTYRDMLKDENLDHSAKTSDETQLKILDFMMKEHEKYQLGSKIIFDRCPWDNLAYTLQGNANGLISDEVTAATISLVRESLRSLDIIFWIRHEPSIKIVSNGVRETDLEFIKTTDGIFSELFHQYSENLESDIFYPKEDCPAIVILEDLTVDDRINFIGEFLDSKGDLIDTENSILDPSNVDLLEQMIQDQQQQTGKEEELGKLMKSFSKK